jgi:hypothetical protein
MLLKRLVLFGVLAAFASLPVLAQVASLPNANERISPIQLHPIHNKAEHGDGTATSTNWSGYAVTGSSFTSAYASWKIPTNTCKSGTQYAAFWVGLDGYSSSTVEQTGTLSECVGKTATYYAWYEFYPNPMYEITSVPVKPGDVISASVVYSSSKFTITLKDVTTGKSYTKTASVSGAARSSAEWIAEAPCCTAGGGILPLADFGTVYLGDDSTAVSGTNYATDSTNSGAIASFGSTVEEITMETSSGTLEATPSALSGDGTSFDVVWDSQ